MPFLDKFRALLAPAPPPRPPLVRLRALVEAKRFEEALELAAGEPRLGNDLGVMLAGLARAAPPAERPRLRALAAGAFWEDNRPLTPGQALIAAQLHLERDDPPGAERALGFIFENEPDHVGALHLKSLALIRRNRFTESLAISRRILALRPDHAASRYHLATLSALDEVELPVPLDEPRPLLVAVGGGVGNIIHATPTLRFLAERLGAPVDVVVAAEVEDGPALVKREGVTGTVTGLVPELFGRRYDRVLILHSFGAIRPGFGTRNLLAARSFEPFDPAGTEAEPAYNLRVACALLGLDPPASPPHPYVGSLPDTPDPEPRLVGFAAGSKGGFWEAKRWPHFGALAARLLAAGWEVASFGLPAEAVPGTQDRTGGSLLEMAARLRRSRLVVANDNGAMNMANALGVPVVGLFGPTNPASRAPAGVEVVALDKPCAPCEANPETRALFRSGECRCIGELGVDTVLQAVLRALG